MPIAGSDYSSPVGHLVLLVVWGIFFLAALTLGANPILTGLIGVGFAIVAVLAGIRVYSWWRPGPDDEPTLFERVAEPEPLEAMPAEPPDRICGRCGQRSPLNVSNCIHCGASYFE